MKGDKRGPKRIGPEVQVLLSKDVSGFPKAEIPIRSYLYPQKIKK